MQHHLAGFDLRKVQHIIDQRQQMFSGRLDFSEVLNILDLAGVPGLLLQHFAISDDGVERRPQLVAHICKKCALGAIRFFGRVLCIEQLFLGLLPVEDFFL